MKRTELKRKTPLKKKRAKPRRKVKTKTAQQLKNELRAVFNRYIRRRDTQVTGWGYCCSCGAAVPFEDMEAGHYIHNCSALRFDETNIHGQCTMCNKWKHGNPTGYALFLVRKYGPEVLEELEARRTTTKRWSKTELQAMLTDYRAKLKKLGG